MADDRVIDLDSARIARAEVSGGPVRLKFGGKDLELPAEAPAEAVLLIDRGDTEGCLRSLVGHEIADDFIRWASIQDLDEFVRGVLRVYGIGAGE